MPWVHHWLCYLAHTDIPHKQYQAVGSSSLAWGLGYLAGRDSGSQMLYLGLELSIKSNQFEV